LQTYGHAIHVPSINEIYLGPGPCIINARENPGKMGMACSKIQGAALYATAPWFGKIFKNH
jgi:hypothetical protein